MSITANTHPITKTLGGYRYSALPAKDTTTHTLLTNPTTHYKASDNGVLPNNPNTWIPFSSSIPKTIYDPCPYGYRVPKDGSWNGFPKNTWTQFAITGGTSGPETNGGWWPAAGYRNGGSAIFNIIGATGHYWSSSRHASSVDCAFYLDFNCYRYMNPNHSNSRSNGFSVRCIEREKINKVSFEIMLLRFIQRISLRATL